MRGLRLGNFTNPLYVLTMQGKILSIAKGSAGEVGCQLYIAGDKGALTRKQLIN
jgi:hypothetical protein